MTVELWMGQPFEYTHERVAVQRLMQSLHTRLGRKRELYLVLANVLIGGKQIDLLILKRDGMFVVELKECSTPFQATENGPWRAPSGRLVGREQENPFEQVKRYRQRWASYLKQNIASIFTPGRAENIDIAQTKAVVCISPRLHAEVRNRIPPLPWFRLLGLDDLAAIVDQHAANDIFTNADLRRLLAGLNLRSPAALSPPDPQINLNFDVPPLSSQLADRVTEQAVLNDCLNDKKTAVISLHGPRGIGKTELTAWLAANGQAQGYRVRWLNCRQRRVSLQSLLASIAAEVPHTQQAHYICDQTQSTADRISAALKYIDSEPTLLVLDDFDTVEEARSISLLVGTVVRYARRTRLVLITRLRPTLLDDPDWRPAAGVELALEGLPRECANELLDSNLLRQLSPEQVDDIWHKTAGNPYLIHVLATTVADLGVMPPVPRLIHGEQLGEWLDAYLPSLSPAARKLADKLSVVSGRLDENLIRLLARPEDQRAKSLSKELVNQHVLRRNAESSVLSMHELIREYLYLKLSDHVRRSAHATVGVYFANLADGAQTEAERLSHLMVALHHYRCAPKPQEYLARCEEAYTLLSARGDWTTAYAAAESAADFANQLNRTREVAAWLLRQGTHEIDEEQFDRARRHLEKALRILPKLSRSAPGAMRLAQTVTKLNLVIQSGRLAYHQQEYATARTQFEMALDLARELDDRRATADCLIRLGQIDRRQSRYAAAYERLSTALTLAEQTGDRELEFEALNYLGVVARRQNDMREASRLYRRAYDLSREMGDQYKEEICVSYLGRLAAHPQTNQLPVAAKFLQQALSIARRIHNTRGIRIELTRYIDVLIALGQFDKAEPLLDESERLNQAVNDQIGIAWNYKHRGQFQQRVDARQGDDLIRQGRQLLDRMGIADDEWRPEFEAALKHGMEG